MLKKMWILGEFSEMSVDNGGIVTQSYTKLLAAVTIAAR
jgi:hypothetical protein